MRMLIIGLSFFLFLCAGAGCSTVPWATKSDPPFQITEKKNYSIILTPISEDYYHYAAFELVIENKTDSNIDLIWDKTYYLRLGQTSGGFMFAGLFYTDKNAPVRPDVIFPGQIFKKAIHPSILSTYYLDDWQHNPMPDGENGIYITLIHKNEEIREKLVVNLFAGYDEAQRKPTVFGKMIQK